MCSKRFENRLTNKHFMPKIFLNRNFVWGKVKQGKTLPVCLCPKLLNPIKKNPQDPKFKFLDPLPIQIPYSKLFFGIKILLVSRFSKFLQHILRQI